MLILYETGYFFISYESDFLGSWHNLLFTLLTVEVVDFCPTLVQCWSSRTNQ